MKKLFAICLAVVLVLLALTGCATTNADDKVIRVGASPTPHALILKAIKPYVEAKGYTLEIIEFDDYVLPNTSLEQGELDANYFAHLPYIENFNKNNGTHIKSVLAVHFEPLGIYPGKSASLDDLEGKTFAIPNDTTNEARALQLLAATGIIELDASKGLEATPRDITSNPHNIKFTELEASFIPRVLPDVDFGIINGNYALSAGIGGTVLLTELVESEAADIYANVLAVREGSENNEKIKVLIEALKSISVREYVLEQFGKLVVLVSE